MRLPSVEQIGDEVSALQREADPLPLDDIDALLEHVAKLQVLAVYLNARLVAPAIAEA